MCAAKKSSVSLKVIASELSKLAEDLNQGRLRVGSNLVDIDPPTFFKTKQKLKDGRVYFTLSFQAPISNNETISDFTPQKEMPTPTASTPPLPKKNGIAQPPEGKKLKKEITRQWKNIVKNFNDNIAPTATESKRILTACEDYNLYTDHQWHQDWQTCCRVVQDTINAAIDGNFNKAMELATEVNRLTKVCHKKYK